MNLHEFCGVCEHKNIADGGMRDGMKLADLCSCGKRIYTTSPHEHRNIDFTTPDGYQILHKAMTERGEWMKFYATQAVRKYGFDREIECVMAGLDFHELTDLSEKVRLLTEYIETLKD